MIKLIFLVVVTVRLATAAPLYGDDGGYKGQASYQPFTQHLYKSGRTSDIAAYEEEGDLEHTGGGYEEHRAPSRKRPRDYQRPPVEVVPKKYDVLQYKPDYHHGGYGSNKVLIDSPSSPYTSATLYGQEKKGYKMADVYRNPQHLGSYTDNEHDYKDDYISNPQPYMYGYKLKDKDGNEQHREETSDGQGSVKGSYGYVDDQGTYRHVEYVADKGGFRAKIKTNEAGTDNENPADVHIEAETSRYAV